MVNPTRICQHHTCSRLLMLHHSSLPTKTPQAATTMRFLCNNHMTMIPRCSTVLSKSSDSHHRTTPSIRANKLFTGSLFSNTCHIQVHLLFKFHTVNHYHHNPTNQLKTGNSHLKAIMPIADLLISLATPNLNSLIRSIIKRCHSGSRHTRLHRLGNKTIQYRDQPHLLDRLCISRVLG